MYLYLCMICLCVRMTGCMIFVVCRTRALIAVLCLTKETNLKKYGNEWGSRMSNKIRSIEHVHIVALHFFWPVSRVGSERIEIRYTGRY